jgi:ribosomal protein S7
MKTMRLTKPDKIHDSMWVTKVINNVMIGGGKGKAERIVYYAIDKSIAKLGTTFVILQEMVKSRISPKSGTLVRKYGGASYNIPVSFTPEQSTNKGIKNLVQSARLALKTKRDTLGRVISRKKSRTMEDSLFSLLVSIFNNETCEPLRKKEEMEKLADQNRAFAYLMRKNNRSSSIKTKAKRGDGISKISQSEVEEASKIDIKIDESTTQDSHTEVSQDV